MEYPRFRGFNFGGWLSQSPKIFEPDHLKNFITEKDIESVKNWGFNCIRLPIDYQFLTPGGDAEEISEASWSVIDNFLIQVEKHGLFAILDLHCCPGHHFNVPEITNIWNDSVARGQTLAIWSSITKRYRSKGPWLLYDILNEPVAPEHEQWNQLAKEITSVIREHDPVHTLIVESNRWADIQTFPFLEPTGDVNTIYSFHFYEPVFFSHQNAKWVKWHDYFSSPVHYPGRIDNLLKLALEHIEDPEFTEKAQSSDKYWCKQALQEILQPVLDFRSTYNAPVFCGEWGVIPHAPRFDRLFWYRDVANLFSENNIGWTVWTYKNMDFGLINKVPPYAGFPEYSSEDNLDYELLEILKNT